MKLPLAQIPPHGRDVAFDVARGELSGVTDGLIRNDVVRVTGQVAPTPQGVRAWGRISSVLTLECGRCLTHFDHPIDSRFDVTFSSRSEDEDELELTEADLEVIHLQGDSVDLVELVREQVLLEVPIAPLCADGCKGICPHCGANLNQGPCACNEAVDPRFAALKKLL